MFSNVDNVKPCSATIAIKFILYASIKKDPERVIRY
jgi:hypothetical protein